MYGFVSQNGCVVTCLQTKNILKSVNEQFTKHISSVLSLVSFAICLYPLLNF